MPVVISVGVLAVDSPLNSYATLPFLKYSLVRSWQGEVGNPARMHADRTRQSSLDFPSVASSSSSFSSQVIDCQSHSSSFLLFYCVAQQQPFPIHVLNPQSLILTQSDHA